jgi:hypothetical protein
MKWSVGLGVGLFFAGSALAGFSTDLSLRLDSNGIANSATPRDAHDQQPGALDFPRSKNRKSRTPDTIGGGSCEQSSPQATGGKNAHGRRNGSASPSIQKRGTGKSGTPSTSTGSTSTGNCPPNGSSGTSTSPEIPNSSQPGGAPNDPLGPPIDDNDDEFDPVGEMGLGGLDPFLPTGNEMGGDDDNGPSAGTGGLLPGIDDSFARMNVPESIGVDTINNDIQSDGVPEPGSLALLGLGLAGLAASGRRKSH